MYCVYKILLGFTCHMGINSKVIYKHIYWGDGGCSLLAGELKVQLYFHISEQQIVQEQVLEILPMVSEVNAVSEELNKQKSFEVVLISAAAQEGGDITQSHASKYVYQLLCCSSFIYIDV